MADFLNTASVKDLIAAFRDLIMNQILTPSSAIQIAAVIVLFFVAWLAAPQLVKGIRSLTNRWGRYHWAARLGETAIQITVPFLWLVMVWMSELVAVNVGYSLRVFSIATSLLSAWIVIQIASTAIRDTTWAKFIAAVAWTIAALNIVGLFDPAVAFLDSAAITFGGVRVSALTVIKGVLSLAILLWAATVVSGLIERRISRARHLTPSVQVLFTKLLKTVLIIVAVIVALESVGIDLTAFTVFTGALGVGIGFGLQKTVSNLISGVIILMDRSIKPGDVIEVGDTYGWINSLGSRYASVITRDGIEHLIPNEELITQRVANWSFSAREVRQKVPIGISYESDVRKAIDLCLEAAGEVERVLDSPNPICLVKGFGDSSVDLELRFWINDPRNGVSNVKSEILLGVWDKFHGAGISIPYPQRDLHIKSGEPLRVVGA